MADSSSSSHLDSHIHTDSPRADSSFSSHLSSHICAGNKQSPRLIVSLTSFPARIHTLHYTLLSMLLQDVKADIIAVFLSTEEFPKKREDLPKILLTLEHLGFIVIHFITHNTRAYKKLIPALEIYPDDIIVTIDDDQFYDRRTLALLVDSFARHNNAIHTHAMYAHNRLQNFLGLSESSGTKMSERIYKENVPMLYAVPLGVSGVLYPPHCLHSDVLKSDIFMQLAPMADDLWFWAMSVKNNVPKVLVNGALGHSYNWTLPCNDGPHLWKINVSKDCNTTQMKNIIEAYPEVKQAVINDM